MGDSLWLASGGMGCRGTGCRWMNYRELLLKQVLHSLPECRVLERGIIECKCPVPAQVNPHEPARSLPREAELQAVRNGFARLDRKVIGEQDALYGVVICCQFFVGHGGGT